MSIESQSEVANEANERKGDVASPGSIVMLSPGTDTGTGTGAGGNNGDALVGNGAGSNVGRRRRLSSLETVVSVEVGNDEIIELDKGILDTAKPSRIRRAQNGTAECCVNSLVEIFFAGATLVFALVVFVQVSLALPGTDLVLVWRALSLASAAFLTLFVVEGIMRAFAFGSSFLRQPSNSAEYLLAIAALVLELTVLGMLFRSEPMTELSGFAVFNSLSKLMLFLFRYRRFQDIISSAFSGALLSRRSKRADHSTAPERLLDLLRRIRRKYPLTVKEVQDVNWASFLVASRRLYTATTDGIEGETSIVYEGLDDETVSWLLSTYSKTQVGATSVGGAQPNPGSPNSPMLSHSQSLVGLEGFSDGANVQTEDPNTCGGRSASGSDSALLKRRGMSLGSDPGNTGHISLATNTILETAKNSIYRADSPRAPEVVKQRGIVASAAAEAAAFRFAKRATMSSEHIVTPRRKSLTPAMISLTPRSNHSRRTSRDVSGSENPEEQMTFDEHNKPNSQEALEPSTLLIGRQITGADTGLEVEDLSRFRSSITLETEIPATHRELQEQRASTPDPEGFLSPHIDPQKLYSQQTHEMLPPRALSWIGGPSGRSQSISIEGKVKTPPQVIIAGGEDDEDETEDDDYRYPPLPSSPPLRSNGSVSGTSFRDWGNAHKRTKTGFGRSTQHQQHLQQQQQQQQQWLQQPKQTLNGQQPIKALAEHARLANITWTQSQVDYINTTLDEWDFDVFEANEFSGGRPLTMVTFAVLRKNEMFNHFESLRWETVLNLLTAVENGYRVDNPYHNRIHAADVVQTTHYFMTHNTLRLAISAQDILCAIVAAAIHDFQHPGTSNSFLIATGDKLALRYNDRAVLEHMHVAAAFQLMRQKRCDILRAVGDVDEYLEARETVIQMVLATDMSHHFEGLERFMTEVVQFFDGERPSVAPVGSPVMEAAAPQRKEPSDDLQLPPLSVRRTLLKTTLHCADVSNPAKKPSLCQRWAVLVQDEFFRQGDKERDAGIKISMFMDRKTPAFHKCQIGFITIIVKPLFASYCRFLTTLKPQVDWCLNANLAHWEQKQAEEERSSSNGGSQFSPVLAPASGNTQTNNSSAPGSTLRGGLRFVSDKFKMLHRTQSLMPESPNALGINSPISGPKKRRNSKNQSSFDVTSPLSARPAAPAVPVLERSQTDGGLSSFIER